LQTPNLQRTKTVLPIHPVGVHRSHENDTGFDAGKAGLTGGTTAGEDDVDVVDDVDDVDDDDDED